MLLVSYIAHLVCSLVGGEQYSPLFRLGHNWSARGPTDARAYERYGVELRHRGVEEELELRRDGEGVEKKLELRRSGDGVGWTVV